MPKRYSEVRPYFPTARHMHGLFRNGSKLPEYTTYLSKDHKIFLSDSKGKTIDIYELDRDKSPIEQSLEIISKRM